MNFEYTLNLDLPLDEAWSTLMDIERIAPCMPGAKIESRDGDDYTGRLKVKLGPMELTYRGDIHFVERDDVAHTAVVDAAAKETKGRGAAKTRVTLRGADAGSGSAVTLVSDFTVSGKAAQFGRGVMEEVGEKLMDDFARRLGAMVEAEAPARAGTTEPAVGAAPAANTTAETAPAAEAPERTVPARAPGSSPDEALDVGGAVFGPVAKRLAWPVAIVVAAGVLYWLL